MEHIPDEVIARWTSDGKIFPQRFAWQGQTYLVESLGRAWQDESGARMLVMVSGGQVFRLTYHPGSGWRLRPPRRTSA